MNTKTVRKLHRWIGLFFALSALMSALSGVIHTVMARTQAPPPPARPSGGLDVSRIKVPPEKALADNSVSVDTVQSINIRSIVGEPCYQIFVKGQSIPTYISAETGKADSAQDEKYAAQIASDFLAGGKIRKSAYLTEFDSEYINIFRILPVHRFDLDDAQHTRVYVSTITGSVARHTDDQRQWEASIFSNFHKLNFITNRNVRDIVLSFMTAGIAIVALTGIVLFFMTRPRRTATDQLTMRISPVVSKEP